MACYSSLGNTMFILITKSVNCDFYYMCVLYLFHESLDGKFGHQEWHYLMKPFHVKDLTQTMVKSVLYLLCMVSVKNVKNRSFSLFYMQMTTPIAIEDVRREVKMLRALTGHKNLVKFYNAYEDEDNVYMVME